MLVDIHIHELNGSSDSKLNILNAIERAEKRNLDAICITDHDSLYLRDKIEYYQKKTDVLLIVGVEIFTLDGDLLCFGIDKLPEKRLSAKDTISFVKKQGGVTIAAHPFRNNNRGIGEKIYELENLDAVETFNGRTQYKNNIYCSNLCKKHSLKECGGSDSHTEAEVGRYVTKFERKINNENEFINAIKHHNYYPVDLKLENKVLFSTAI